MSRLLLPLLLFGLAAGLCAPAFGQGASREDARLLREQLRTLDLDSVLAERPRSVDLRPLFPEVGEQTMNDCVAWAFGYYTRSYLEALDQGWMPDGPERIFSPSFIYNQINNGEDEGSNPMEALELLRDIGAATLRTFPYAAGDHLKSPPSIAEEEAPAFKIDNFYLIQNGAQMRESLALGRPVCVGIRTNPVFSAGRYRTYSADDHARGAALRTPEQPHGYHAMVVVGYDDDREAFLFLNSWGKDWATGGAAWISYEVADSFNLNERSDGLVDFGVVMVDRVAPVVKSGVVWEEVDYDDLGISVRPEFLRVDVDQVAHYRLLLKLGGPMETMDAVESATWTHTSNDGTPVRTEGERSPFINDFDAQVTTTDLQVSVEVELQMANGEQRTIATDVSIDPGSLRSAALKSFDAYYGLDKESGAPLWRWTLEPQMSAREWSALEKIEWTFTEDGEERTDLYFHSGGSTPPSNRHASARLSRQSAAPASGKALFTFRDGSEIELPLPEQAFTAPREEAMTVDVQYRQEGVFHDQNWVHFDAVATVPEGWGPFVDRAFFIVEGLSEDGTPTVLAGEPTLWPAARGFAVSGYACRSLDVAARVILRIDPSFRGDRFDLEELFTYFEDSDRWDSETTRRAEVVRMDLGTPVQDIGWTDSYEGIVDGKPLWRYSLHWVDRADTDVGQVSWSFGDEATDLGETDDFSFYIKPRSAHAGARLEVEAVGLDWEDTERGRVQRVVEARSPQTNAFSLDVESGVAPALDRVGEVFAEPISSVAVRGPLQQLRQVLQVAYAMPSEAGGWREAVLQRPVGDVGMEALTRGRMPTPTSAEPARVRLRLVDGSEILLEGQAHGYSPYPVAAEFQLEARESAWAIEDDRPVWLVRVGLRGQTDSLAQVESIAIQATREDGSSFAVDAPELEGGATEVLTSVPLRFTATVRFLAEAGRPDLLLHAYATTQTEIPVEPLHAAWAEVGGEVAVEVDPNVDPAFMEEPATTFALCVRGWERELRRIESVEWQITDNEAASYIDDYKPETHLVKSRDGSPLVGFGMKLVSLYPDFDITPTVRFLGGGEERALQSVKVDDSRWTPAVGAMTKVHYWGDDEAGQPTWLVLCEHEDLSSLAKPSEAVRYGFETKTRNAVVSPEAPEALRSLLPADDTGRAWIYSTVRPGFLAELVLSETSYLRSADRFYIDELNRFDVPELTDSDALKDDDLALTLVPETIDERQLVLRKLDGPGRSAVLGLRGPLSQTVGARSVRYSVTLDGTEHSFVPFAVSGWGHERFDLRIPSGVELGAAKAELIGPDGEVLQTLSLP